MCQVSFRGIAQSKSVHLRNIGDEEDFSLNGQVPVVELWVNVDVQSRLKNYIQLDVYASI